MSCNFYVGIFYCKVVIYHLFKFVHNLLMVSKVYFCGKGYLEALFEVKYNVTLLSSCTKMVLSLSLINFFYFWLILTICVYLREREMQRKRDDWRKITQVHFIYYNRFMSRGFDLKVFPQHENVLTWKELINAIYIFHENKFCKFIDVQIDLKTYLNFLPLPFIPFHHIFLDKLKQFL